MDRAAQGVFQKVVNSNNDPGFGCLLQEENLAVPGWCPCRMSKGHSTPAGCLLVTGPAALRTASLKPGPHDRNCLSARPVSAREQDIPVCGSPQLGKGDGLSLRRRSLWFSCPRCCCSDDHCHRHYRHHCTPRGPPPVRVPLL